MHDLSGRQLAELAVSELAERRQLPYFEVPPPRSENRVGGRCLDQHVGEAKAIEATSETLTGR
jgi:hypothetical protein